MSYKTHGQSFVNGRPTRTYVAWNAMMNRCHWTPLQEYGGRGIKVCSRWHKFENFRFDMGEKPSGMTLGRVDNNGGYCKENCRWESCKQQANNRRSNHIVNFSGKSMTVTQWAEILGISRDTLYSRLRTWSVERALNTPLMIQFSRFEHG